MKKNEKDIITAIIYDILMKIPLPITGGGTQSASLQGYIDYGNEMAQVKGDIENALRYLRDGEFDDCNEEIAKIKSKIKLFEQKREVTKCE